ncbi:hypothetical protein MPDQ_000781 [Monascus purpureus]|uniref:1,3-beta-glucanosyltransferase n=1 Tax=Monascus purpureus TaxID=5098 RepID=A0A507QNW4_MONPU|nr:hypothetical protein MPDQ_000781 [Monascus purpureus]BDD62516.1 hypothetical protein MAP00_007484 [Monascus purpureus]
MRLSSPSLLAASLLLSLQTDLVLAAPKISTVGAKFFYENGTQFFIKGIAYQLVPDDPLIDTEQCKRDIVRMSELGANAIRVYHVDPLADHSGCMKAFADAGIYLFVDLDTFHTQIEQQSPHWNATQFAAFQAVLDEFQKYDNTAGVFVGNEVLTTKDGAAAAPYVLAAAHDIKLYRDRKGYRKIPVGYSAADIAELRPMLQNYMACSPNPDSRLDFFALNAYEWCGQSSYTFSGYVNLQKNASGYPIPIFFSETGCNVARPRTFEDQGAIFGDEMSGTWSGSMVYEWIQETNDYGLISYGPPAPGGAAAATNTLVDDGFTRKGTPTPVSPDFSNLKSQWATLSPTGVALSVYAESTSAITLPECPSSTAGGWAVDPSAPLPILIYGPRDHNYTRSRSSVLIVASATASSQGLASATSSAKHSGAMGLGNTGAGSDGWMHAWMLLCGLVGVVAWWL